MNIKQNRAAFKKSDYEQKKKKRLRNLRMKDEHQGHFWGNEWSQKKGFCVGH